MALVKADPFRVELPELFNWLRWPEYRFFPEQLWGESSLRIEEYTEGDTMVLRAELPGVDPDTDVEVTVADGMLTIRAERTEETHAGDARKGYRSEFRYGALVRTVPLPAGVDATDVKATYTDGILEIRLPIGTLTEKPTRIAVTRT